MSPAAWASSPRGRWAVPRAQALWKHRLVWTAVTVLLLTLVQCAAETSHAGERLTGHVGAVSRTLPPPEERPTTEALDGSESPAGCSASDPGPAGTAPASVRGLPSVSAVTDPTNPVRPLTADHLGAARNRIPDDGRTAPAVLCRWLI
ncbi:hypothetical protein [Streptomyces sp. BA2]|uniref:hypothetical protein n=1 Tax=Streptomyces sp. BA2 TaxID=436595 RepID=UPI00132771C3|nr:hypothetical protein [Streptomyces sp. BA2]MWA08405.1 hypothetical protein [Streptomyces sp. BA2]